MEEQENDELNPSSSKEAAEASKPTHRRGLRVIKLEKRVSAIFSILSKLFVISAILVASVFVFRELSDESYHIDQVNVPAAFEDAGLSGAVVANMIQGRLAEMIEVLRKHDEALQYINASERVDVEVDMVGLGVPIRGVVTLMGEALGVKPRRKISADIFTSGPKISIILRVTGQAPEWYDVEGDEKDLKGRVRELVDEVSKGILKYTDPQLLELYYANIKHDGPNTVKMAKYLLEKFGDDPVMAGHAYDSWAWGLLYEGKLEEAIAKLEEGLKLYPNEHRFFNTWGNVLAKMGKDEEAIQKFKHFFSVATPAELTVYRRTTLYINTGISFAYLGQMDSAMAYMQKALALDKDDWIIYYDIAGISLMKNDTVAFYEYFERSLEKGADVEMVRGDTDLAEMLKEKRVMELLEKYSQR
jgi:hypothetical protein